MPYLYKPSCPAAIVRGGDDPAKAEARLAEVARKTLPERNQHILLRYACGQVKTQYHYSQVNQARAMRLSVKGTR